MGMMTRIENIEGFHLKVSPTEKELYEEFLKAEEAEIVREMQGYFAGGKAEVRRHQVRQQDFLVEDRK
jgi:hypothetical protein